MTNPVIILAPNGRWGALQQTGVAAVDGYVFTYENQTRTPKVTYQDPAGQIPNTNPIRLDSKGEANIYWDITDTYYTIEVYQASPTAPFFPSELIYSQDNYPFVNGTGGGDIIVNTAAENLIRNSQFTIWGSNDYLLSPSLTPQDTYERLGLYEVICNDFIFERNNTNATISISRNHFNAGQTDVPANPVNYLTYQCTNVGLGGENLKAISQIYQSAETLNGQQISVGIYGKSVTNSPFTVYITQNFGTGGSPSDPVTTEVISDTFTNSWEQYIGTITIPSVAGKVFGTNGNDYLKISIGLPLNAVSTIDVCNFQFHGSSTLQTFNYISVNDQIKRLDSIVNEGTSRTGDFLLTISDDDRTGWVLCDDQTIGSYFSDAIHVGNEYIHLYLTIWNKVPNSYAPIYDSSGALTTRGSSAIDDWNDDKQLNLTRVLGRLFGAVGQPDLFMQFTVQVSPQTFTASTSTNQLTVSSTAGIVTGQAVTMTTTGTLPSPLLVGTTYYAVVLTPTTLKLSTSFSNAINGTTINLTTVGTGVNSIYADDLLDVDDALSFYTGTPVVVTTQGGTLPSPLVNNTTYYAIYRDSAHFSLATTLSNALAGASIPLTTTGSGTNIATITYNKSLANGQSIGEFSHWQTVGETSLHTHPDFVYSLQNAGTSSGSSAQAQISSNTGVTNGGGLSPFNITPPSIYTNCFLKL